MLCRLADAAYSCLLIKRVKLFFNIILPLCVTTFPRPWFSSAHILLLFVMAFSVIVTTPTLSCGYSRPMCMHTGKFVPKKPVHYCEQEVYWSEFDLSTKVFINDVQDTNMDICVAIVTQAAPLYDPIHNDLQSQTFYYTSRVLVRKSHSVIVFMIKTVTQAINIRIHSLYNIMFS